MPLPLIEIPVSPRPTVLTAAIRQEILSVLAGSDTVTVPSATSQVAAGWSARRRRRGDSPAAVRAAAAMVSLVGADLVDEVVVEPSRDRRVPRSSRRLATRGAPRWTPRPDVPVSAGPGGSEPLGRRRALFHTTTNDA